MIKDFLQFEGYLPESRIKLKSFVMALQVTIRVITKLPNSEQSYKGKIKPHKYINRQNQSTTGKL